MAVQTAYWTLGDHTNHTMAWEPLPCFACLVNASLPAVATLLLGLGGSESMDHPPSSHPSAVDASLDGENARSKASKGLAISSPAPTPTPIGPPGLGTSRKRRAFAHPTSRPDPACKPGSGVAHLAPSDGKAYLVPAPARHRRCTQSHDDGGGGDSRPAARAYPWTLWCA